MAAGKVIGQIQVTEGNIKVVGVDGTVREPGYQGYMYENEQVVSNDPNALFQIKFLALPEASAYDGVFRILADGSVIHGRDAMDSMMSDENLVSILETSAGDENIEDLETAAGEESADGSSSFTETDIVAESSVLGFNRGANSELGYGVTDFGTLESYDAGQQDVNSPAITSQNVVIYDENDTAPVIQIRAAAESDVTYSISGLDSNLFNIDSATGLVTFKESPDFENPRDLSGDNEYNTYVTVTDALGNYTTQLLSVSINNLNDNVPLADDASNSATEDVPVEVSGQLSGSDADGNAIEFVLVKGLNDGEGTLVFNSNGTYTYNIGDAFQDLDEGQTKDITFTYKTAEAAGSEPSDQGPFESTEATVTITITGAEDGPVISGTFVGGTAEDAVVLSVSGTLAISDVDTLDNPVTFSNVATTAGDNGYGTFTLVDGTWTYTLNNSAVQFLDNGQSVNDTHTFTATDGSSQQVVVTIAGAEDASIITGTYTGSVAEDGTLTANGTLAISDIDTLDNPSFSDVATTAGDNGYGTFELTNGIWTYTLNNTTAQSLDVGESVNDTYTFTATDGSAQQVVVTIAGAEDASIITGTYTGSVAEDGTLIANGALAISDIDALDNPSFSDVATTAGDNGYGTFTMVDGTWKYTLNNSAVQFLDNGQSVNDTHTFTATDGSSQQVVVTIAGAEDASIITGTYTGSVAEDGTLTANGTLAISDIDTLDNPSFSDVATAAGDNGYGTFTLVDGTWTYTLNNNAVQFLDNGQSVNDTHTFTATDGSAQQVVVTIAGAEDGPTITVTVTPNEIIEDSATQDTIVASFAADDVDSDNSAMTYAITAGTDTNGYYVIDGSDVKLTAVGVAHVNGGGELYDISVTVSSSGLNATDSDTAPEITPAADPLVVYAELGTVGAPLFDLADFTLESDPDFVNGVSTTYSSNGLIITSDTPLNFNPGHGLGVDTVIDNTSSEAMNIDGRYDEGLNIELPSSVFALNIDLKLTSGDLIEIKLYDEGGNLITSGVTFAKSNGTLLSVDANGYIDGDDLKNGGDTIRVMSDTKFAEIFIADANADSQDGFSLINIYDPMSIAGFYTYTYNMDLILQEIDEAVDSVTVSGFDNMIETKLIFTYGDNTEVEYEAVDGVITVDDADLLADVVNGDVVVTIAAQSEISDGFQPAFDATTIESDTGVPVSHTILGGTADEILAGEEGNDYIDGRDGSDAIYGDAGNDDIEYDAFDAEIDGGEGFDTLIGNAESINLANISNIDVIQLNAGTTVMGSGADLGINASDVISATDDGTLIIQSADGGVSNQVNIDTDSLELQTESVNIDGINYAQYIGEFDGNAATLLIELNDNIVVD